MHRTAALETSSETRSDQEAPRSRRGTRASAPGTARAHWALYAVPIIFALVLHGVRLFFDRAFVNNDFLVHYRWSVDFSRAFRDGELYPRWMPTANFGLGEPALLIYAPIYYWAVSLVRLITPSVWEAMKIVETASIALTGVVVFHSVRRVVHADRWALAAAVAVQSSPMILMLFDYFNGLPWATSAAAATVVICYTALPPRRMWAGLNVPVILGVAAVVMTHTLSGVMTLLCAPFAHARLFGWRPFARPTRKGWLTMAGWALSAGLGLLMAMVYLYPAVKAMGLVTPAVFTTKYTYHDAFIFPTATYLAFGMRWFAFQVPVPAVLAAATLATTLYLVRERGAGADADPSAAARHEMMIALNVVSWVSLFFACELSWPLWRVPSPLQLVQFPHRFLYVNSIAASVAVVLAASEVRVVRWRRILVTPLLASLALAAVLEAKMGLFDGVAIRTAPDSRFTLDSDTIAPYQGADEYRLPTAMAAAGLACGEPGCGWKQYLHDGGLEGECARTGARCEALGAHGDSRSWRITRAEAGAVRLPVFGFPGWSVAVGSGPFGPAKIEAGTGLIQVEVPGGAATDVHVRWSGIPEEAVGRALGLAGLTMFGLVCFGTVLFGRTAEVAAALRADTAEPEASRARPPLPRVPTPAARPAGGEWRQPRPASVGRTRAPSRRGSTTGDS